MARFLIKAVPVRLGPHRQMSRPLKCKGNRHGITVYVPTMPERVMIRDIMEDVWSPLDGLARFWHQTPREALREAVRAAYGPSCADARVTIQFVAPERPRQVYQPTGFPVGRPRSKPRREE